VRHQGRAKERKREGERRRRRREGEEKGRRRRRSHAHQLLEVITGELLLPAHRQALSSSSSSHGGAPRSIYSLKLSLGASYYSWRPSLTW
jgi:hypothetical protein